MSDLPKTFDPAEIEARWYAHWETRGLFRPERPGAKPWTIVNPPPNVTGSLHIGHALDNTLQDILVRHARLKGLDARWVVGMDHAGIATQMVVERQMAERQDKRTNYAREEFIDKVWEWKAESGGAITRQLRRLGCSMDWANERFTMDEGFSKAVLKVFVDLYNQGLIYRDKRLVNWDPALKTAISDLEVETHDVQGHFWHFRYPLADGACLDDGRDYIEVATTRPETMLADMAVAVHPDDARYRSVIGKFIEQPITGRRIRIIADEHADPELGSGAVKITPGHDFNDFEVGKRAGIAPAQILNMLDAEARVVQTADGLVPEEYLGLDRFEARSAIVARMKVLGCLIPHVVRDKEGNETALDAEPRTIATPYGDRGGVVIEPWLTDQWYVDAAKLAQRPIEAVRSGAIEIVPKSWEKTFFNWMENIQPWCVSRQLWWGHRIPAWFGPTAKQVNEQIREYDRVVFVGVDEAEVSVAAAEYYRANGCTFDQIVFFDSESASAQPFLVPNAIRLYRDPDVLDTWFSSALWPFATLGWPENGDPTLGGRYPNDVLISGFDILFFWDARMMMQGTHFMKDVPFRKLYLHGLVRAADGQKMSKSKGNVVDPLGLIDKYGADALRFFMAAMESQGRDIKMDERRVEGYRNFATKLWNAARFAQGNGIGGGTSAPPPPATLAVNKWIIGEVVETVRAVDAALADLRFDGAANAIYHFVWDRFCDWYLELIKGAIDDETRAVAGWVLDRILVLLHPFMPFITEELWSKLGTREHELIVARWPVVDDVAVDTEAKAEIDWLIRLVSEIRSARTQLGVAPGAAMRGEIEGGDDAFENKLNRNWGSILRLARIDLKNMASENTAAFFQVVVDDVTYKLYLDGIIDIAAERARLTKAVAAAEKERDALAGRLGNASFVERAKPEAVEKARTDHAEKSAEAERLAAALARLG